MSTSPGREKYPHVFEPIALGPVTVPNRIYFSPHGIALHAGSRMASDVKVPSKSRVGYFAERARGGTGLIMHSSIIGPFAVQDPVAETSGLEEAIPDFAAVADAVHEHGSKIMAEIWYVNWLPKRWEELGPEAPSLSPSESANLYQPTVRREMTKWEIDQLREWFVISTRNLRAAGYDGIQLHMSHGAITEYFLSPHFNRRTDEYGGSLENRLRFTVECLRDIREAMGPELALSIRFNVDQMIPGGYGQEDAMEALRRLCALNILDFVDLDISFEPEQIHLMTTGMFDPVMHNAERVKKVREAVDIPVIATPGRVNRIQQAEDLLKDGVADVIGMVRGLIAEPHMVRKALEGRENESRRCVAVNECVSQFNVGWGCAVNATAGKEDRWPDDLIDEADRTMNVVVVGGGPAGLEAARMAALRGHRVTLLEAQDELGGGTALWAKLPGREAMAQMAEYFKIRLPEIGVEVQTGVKASAEDVLALSPDIVVVATGSVYDPSGAGGASPYPIPGHDQPWVHTFEDIVRDGLELSGKVVVFDDEGFHPGCGVAELLANRGATVELVSRKLTPAASIGIAIGYAVGRLRASGVVQHNGTLVTQIGDHEVSLLELMSQSPSTIEGVDHVVLTTARLAVHALEAELEGKVDYVYVVGDALAPRTLRVATYEGHRFGRVIGDPDMPANISEAMFDRKPWAQVPAAESGEPAIV